jgi:hypothetical protein
MSKVFENLYRQDQYHIKRWEEKYTDKQFYDINRKIRAKLRAALQKRKTLSGRECFIAAMIFHHGFTLASSKLAQKYERLCRTKQYHRNKWLVASITDRMLQIQGKPQKYGTQIYRTKTGKIRQYRVDGSITDSQRTAIGLPTLKQLKKYVEQ